MDVEDEDTEPNDFFLLSPLLWNLGSFSVHFLPFDAGEGVNCSSLDVASEFRLGVRCGEICWEAPIFVS